MGSEGPKVVSIRGGDCTVVAIILPCLLTCSRAASSAAALWCWWTSKARCRTFMHQKLTRSDGLESSPRAATTLTGMVEEEGA